jgi:hypothetical protein
MIGLFTGLKLEYDVIVPMQIPREKKIYPQASAHIAGLPRRAPKSGSVPSGKTPLRYIRIPASAFSRVRPFMTMMKMKATGSGTVIQTTYELELTPFQRQK